MAKPTINPKSKTKRMIVVDTAITLPVILNFQGVEYKLQPDCVVPEDCFAKFEDFAQYEEYDEANKRHVELVKKKDTLFTTRKDYGDFDLQKSWERLSPTQKDEIQAIIDNMLDPKEINLGKLSPAEEHARVKEPAKTVAELEKIAKDKAEKDKIELEKKKLAEKEKIGSINIDHTNPFKV